MAEAPTPLQNADFGRTTEFLQEFVGGIFKPTLKPTPGAPLSAAAQARENITANQLPPNGDEVATLDPIVNGPLVSESPKPLFGGADSRIPWLAIVAGLGVAFFLFRKG